jgi:hypothetical protein
VTVSFSRRTLLHGVGYCKVIITYKVKEACRMMAVLSAKVLWTGLVEAFFYEAM